MIVWLLLVIIIHPTASQKTAEFLPRRYEYADDVFGPAPDWLKLENAPFVVFPAVILVLVLALRWIGRSAPTIPTSEIENRRISYLTGRRPRLLFDPVAIMRPIDYDDDDRIIPAGPVDGVLRISVDDRRSSVIVFLPTTTTTTPVLVSTDDDDDDKPTVGSNYGETVRLTADGSVRDYAACSSSAPIAAVVASPEQLVLPAAPLPTIIEVY